MHITSLVKPGYFVSQFAPIRARRTAFDDATDGGSAGIEEMDSWRRLKDMTADAEGKITVKPSSDGEDRLGVGGS